MLVLQCYMAPHDEEDDPAVYRSGPSRKKTSLDEADGQISSPHKDHSNGKSVDTAEGLAPTGVQDEEVDMDEDGEGDDDEEDSTLLTVQPSFNRLLLVLRDEGVMHFVKYVSAAAQGSRWDICGEYEVGMVEEDDD